MKQKRNEYRLQVYLNDLAAQAAFLDEAIRQLARELERCSQSDASRLENVPGRALEAT